MNENTRMPFHWQQVQSAIWLIGMAVLFWTGWWWPGMLILVAVSGLIQAGISAYVSSQEAKKEQLRRAQIQRSTAEARLPEQCPNCGGPLNAKSVTWTSPNTATCPYCSRPVKAL